MNFLDSFLPTVVSVPLEMVLGTSGNWSGGSRAVLSWVTAHTGFSEVQSYGCVDGTACGET